MASSLHKFQVALRLCENHNKKELIAYCKTCKEKICSGCIKEDHSAHDWETIADILREKKRTLPKECKEIRDNNLPVLKKEINRFDQKVQREDATLEQNKHILNSSRQSYVDQINKLFDARIDECQQKHAKTVSTYRERRDGLSQKVEYLEMMTTSLDRDINTLPDHDILDMEKEMRLEMEKVLSFSADKYTCTTVFIPSQMDVQNLENMIGEIHSVSVEETNDIDTQSGAIYSMSPVSETCTWLVTDQEKCPKLIDRTGREKKRMRTPCNDINISTSGEYLFSDETKCIVLNLTKDEKIIRTIDTSPFHPTYIQRTENGDILVTLRDGGDNYNLITTSRRFVQRMNLTGKVLKNYEFREDGKRRLFTLPGRTAENKNTDICVVNMLSYGIGELVALRKDGRIRFTYRGNGLDTDMFYPVDVECDEKCSILMTDGISRSIHMLSAEGMYLCTLCEYEQLYPLTISIYGDNLWCGFLNGRMKVFRYLSN